MIVIKGNKEIHLNEGCVTAIGKFDGVHKGHAKLIKLAVAKAKEAGLKSLVFTFDSVPKEITGNDYKTLTSPEEKEYLIEKSGVDILIEYPFDRELMKMTPEAFIEEILKGKLNSKMIIVGEDFRFGKNKSGDRRTLEKHFKDNLIAVQKEQVNGINCSSTLIKEYLIKGNLKKAEEMLGHGYIIGGTTKSGDRIGRKNLFPTMNLYPGGSKALPPLGVYATITEFNNVIYKSITNIGCNPTIGNNRNISVETYLLDYKTEEFRENYDKKLIHKLVKQIRPEKKFDTKEEMYDQIKKDVVIAGKILDNKGQM